MQFRNSQSHYGVVAVALHWIVALAVVGMFGLGFWMVDLTYYDEWYKKGPDIHRSIGVLLFLLMMLRVIWRGVNKNPAPLPGHKQWEILGAHTAHLLLYILLFVAMISGYLISTADGSAINVFGWFGVPSVTGQIKGMEDTAGIVHYWSTWVIIVLAAVHAAGAIKHHVADRDDTLKRMLGW
jgi:cytochrome b561